MSLMIVLFFINFGGVTPQSRALLSAFLSRYFRVVVVQEARMFTVGRTRAYHTSEAWEPTRTLHAHRSTWTVVQISYGAALQRAKHESQERPQHLQGSPFGQSRTWMGCNVWGYVAHPGTIGTAIYGDVEVKCSWPKTHHATLTIFASLDIEWSQVSTLIKLTPLWATTIARRRKGN